MCDQAMKVSKSAEESAFRATSLPAESGRDCWNQLQATCAGVPERIPDMPLTEVKLVNIKLLTLAELKLITDRGAEGRRRLSELFAAPERLVSSLHRPSAV